MICYRTEVMSRILSNSQITLSFLSLADQQIFEICNCRTGHKPSNRYTIRLVLSNTSFEVGEPNLYDHRGLRNYIQIRLSMNSHLNRLLSSSMCEQFVYEERSRVHQFSPRDTKCNTGQNAVCETLWQVLFQRILHLLIQHLFRRARNPQVLHFIFHGRNCYIQSALLVPSI